MRTAIITLFSLVAFFKISFAQDIIFCNDISNEKCKPIGTSDTWKLENGQASFYMIVKLDKPLTTPRLQYKLVRNGKTDKPVLVNDIMGYEPNKALPCLNTNIVIDRNGDYTVYILDDDDKVITQSAFKVTGSKGLN